MHSLIFAIASIALIAGSSVDANAAGKHLFYIHGCCINKLGGAAYETIAKDLENSGFSVKFDLRYDDSDAEVKDYAAKIAAQVKNLLAQGTAPENITVSGYSLGSVTAMFASIAIANPSVNYVLLAGCPGKGARQFDIDYTKVQGRILSIIDVKDDKFGTCKERFPESVLQKEIAIDSGLGHAVFRYADEKNIKLWKAHLISWSDGK